eukprot:CAMPEP_0182882788 /NCGR_PEP_ID=MMETSP0034_2-20130328/17991_1 /TAXON_ID=156128 /ORGANISM="Nephroselmis pyriformis, Strain CCMP717" /LENGTH=179 /DNA_ID=CAMNT_0025015897 /DNA_START=110 /DNA_END=650 /DNA_ORIENTATION=-
MRLERSDDPITLHVDSSEAVKSGEHVPKINDTVFVAETHLAVNQATQADRDGVQVDSCDPVKCVVLNILAAYTKPRWMGSRAAWGLDVGADASPGFKVVFSIHGRVELDESGGFIDPAASGASFVPMAKPLVLIRRLILDPDPDVAISFDNKAHSLSKTTARVGPGNHVLIVCTSSRTP